MLHLMRTIRLLAVLSVALLVIGGCGSGSARDVNGDAPTTPAVTASASDTEMSCRGALSWPGSAMVDRMPNGQNSDLVPALEALAADGTPDLPPLLRDGRVDDSDWFVLARDGHAAAVATGPWTATGPGPGARVIYLDNEGGWKVTSWDDCDSFMPRE